MSWYEQSTVEEQENEVVNPYDSIPDLDLVKMIQNAKGKTNSNRPPDGFLHPSEMNKCSRILYWNWTYGPPNNKKDEFPTSAKFAVDIGTRIHEMLEGLMLSVDEIEFQNEVHLESIEDNIRGTCDGILTVKETGVKYIIEFKSTKSSLYEIFALQPKKEHWQQVQLYLHMSGIDVGYVLYFNKDDNRMAQHRVEKDPRFLESFLKRSQYIKQKFDKEQVPGKYLSCTNLNNLDKRCANYMRCKNYEAGLEVK